MIEKVAAMEPDSDVESMDSDEELQVAFANNLLKPGLNVEVQPKKTVINRKEDMKNILTGFYLNLNWSERLDMTSETSVKEELESASTGDGDQKAVNNDFQRELCFYKQAQSAVLDALPKLQKLGIPTRRPDDYFAEMAKSDRHMKRIREKLLAREVGMERSEKAKKLRAARKFGKQVQVEVLKKRAQEKKKMLEEVKKFRKGQKDKLDFLADIEADDKSKAKGKQRTPKKASTSKDQQKNQPNKKRQNKNERFGFGGQKKRSKANTAQSFDNLTPMESMMLNQSSRKQNQKGKKQKGKEQRPGKDRRLHNKFRNKNKKRA